MKHFTEQIDYYTDYNPKINEINQKYDSKFNAEKNHENVPSQIRGGSCHCCRFCIKNRINNTVDKYKNYPSLHRIYINECAKESNNFITCYKTHKEYFHNNIFEELMMVVWHPKNISRFEELN